MTWQPIETCPKTDEDILVCGWKESDYAFGEPVYRGRYVTISSYEDQPYRRGIGHRNGARNVTHWQPLPKPPEEK